MTIRARPRHLFSWGFDLHFDDASVVGFDVAWLREAGRFDWMGTEYELRREGPWVGNFLLMANGQVLARATKDSVFARRFTVHIDGRELTLRAAAWLVRRFELIEEQSMVGEVTPDHFLTRSCTAQFPQDLSVPVQVFLFWLVVLMWRRAANASAGS